jgi:tRNA (cytidine/uridine-2'-O-)-methyltransferase
MLEIVLVAPQIAMNTGNIIRLCANTGARLHLIEPLGFTLDDAALRRGGLDYGELTDTTRWGSWRECRAALRGRWYATTAHASAVRYDDVAYRRGDVVVFGCEATGLPSELLREFEPEARIGLPMRPHNRSLNLASAVAVVAYEAWRQHGFAGAASGTLGAFEETRTPLV